MNLTINDNIFKIKIAASKNERAIGMMKKKFHDEYNGMLFLQGYGNHCFWMKNCIIPLDIIFLSNGVIGKIYHSCPPCKDDCDENYCFDGDLVLELEGGKCEELGIKEGDVISLI